MYSLLKTVSAHSRAIVATTTTKAQNKVTNQWTEVLMAVQGLGTLARVCGWALREHHAEIILFCVTTTSMADPLAAHVLFFALHDISSGTRDIQG